MGAPWALLFLPILLGLPFACVGIILRLCESSWQKPAGGMGSAFLLACYRLVCALNILLACVAAIVAAWFGD